MKSTRCILSIILGLLAGWLPLGAVTVLKNLQVEYQTNPLGIDVSQPRFNWQMESDRYGACGQAYRLWVADSPEQLAAGRYIYDSGKVLSGESVGVVYQGKALQPSTRYYWKVSVWDESGTEITSTEPAWFETGLLGSGWSGARWIGSSETQLSKYRSHYVIDYDVRVAEGNDKAVFVFGSRDADNYVSAELDLNGSGDARFILRHTTDGKTRQDAAESLASIIPASDKHKVHHIRLKVTTAQYALRYFVDIEIDGKTLVNSSLTPEEKERKSRGDFWGGKEGAFTVYPYPDGELVYHCRLYAIGFLQPKGQTATFSNLRISEDTWNTLLYNPAETYVEKGEGKLNVWYPGENVSAPMLRKAIKIEKPVKSARLYATARGIYEFSVNGRKVGKDYLNPGWTDYRYRIMYNTYDITSLLRPGDNGIGAMLGAGWWSEHSGFLTGWQDQYGTRQSLLGKIVIEYADGTRETIVTNDSWKCYDRGPITFNGLQNGEEYDARKEVNGWDAPGFDDSSWKPATLFAAPPVNVEIQGYVGSPIQNNVTLTAQSVVEPIPGVYVYDMGQNMVGVPRLTFKGKAGQEITIRFGEMNYPETIPTEPVAPYTIAMYKEKKGQVYTDNYRSALSTDRYILRGDAAGETYEPRFTFHGFRYVEIHGLERPLPLEAVKGIVLESIGARTSGYETSDERVNRLFSNIIWGQRGNFLSVPTDCPQREKNGWTADAHIAIDLGLLGFDGITLYEKWMDDIIDNQREAGEISGIIPSSGWGYGEWPGPVWDAVMFIIPNALYDYYGESRSIERLYPTMLRYLDYLKTKEKDGYLPFGLGDWVYWKATTNNEYTSTAYYYLDYKLMARFASLLGKDAAPYQEKANTLKSLINQKFFNAETGVYAEGTQTAQALALYLGLVPEGKEQLVADKLREVVAGNNYFLDFGLLGSKTVPAMLTKYGYIEDAMKMITKTEAPSWGYWVETMGYSTLPETWTLSPKFADASLNHVFMGDVSAWMMNQLAGINHDDSAPGFRHIRITPHFVKELDWAKGEYHSVRGRIASEWKREGDKVMLTVTIPADCSADIVVGDQTETVSAGTHTFSYPV